MNICLEFKEDALKTLQGAHKKKNWPPSGNKCQLWVTKMDLKVTLGTSEN